MKIAIVDDFELDRDDMIGAIREYCEEQKIDVEYDVFHSGEKFLEQYSKGQYEIVTLDIYMEAKSGMDIAKFLREQGDDCKILFSTSSQEFAVESYEVGATYYILKPVQKDKVKKALNLCVNSKKKEKVIEVICERLPVQIIVPNIYWVETLRNVLVIHLEKQEIKTYMTFQNLMDKLEGDKRFLVSCKGCLLNMDQVSEVAEFDFIMKNGDHVQIRKRGGKQVKADYLQYIVTV